MKTLEDALGIANSLINDIIFMCEARTKSTYFTRDGKMGFKRIILFMLNFVKKSIQIELDSFMKKINGEEITKQGFTEARKKISPTAFIKLSNATTSWYYGDNDFKTYRGYKLCAIDGTILGINNTEILQKSFGYATTQGRKVARALACCIYDIENDMILTSKITRFDASERSLAIVLIEQMRSIGLKKELILFDRGYPSITLIDYLENNGIKYLMRVQRTYFKAVMAAQGEDRIVEVKKKGKRAKVRVLRFDLESGEEEILLTNLFDEDMGVKDFKELYFKRWGIETKYNEIKNKLQIENFTGGTPLVIEQDFYAAMYLTNLASIAKAEANQRIAQRNHDKNLKYEYKVNTNMLIGKLKDSLILTLLEENPRKRKKMLAMIMDEISRNYIPIRPGRKNSRNMSLRANKYTITQKKVL